MTKGIILFDIDRTIFDTDMFGERLDGKIIELLGNIDKDRFLSVTNNYINSLKDNREYDPDDYIQVLCREFNYKTPKLLEAVYYGRENIYKDLVYPETYKVFNRLTPDYKLGIFSEGTKKFQNHKFVSLDLNEYIDPDLIFIFDAKDTKEALAKIPKEAIIIDDKKHICEFLTENGFKAIWLNKKDGEESTEFPVVHNLLDLPNKLM